MKIQSSFQCHAVDLTKPDTIDLTISIGERREVRKTSRKLVDRSKDPVYFIDFPGLLGEFMLRTLT